LKNYLIWLWNDHDQFFMLFAHQNIIFWCSERDKRLKSPRKKKVIKIQLKHKFQNVINIANDVVNCILDFVLIYGFLYKPVMKWSISSTTFFKLYLYFLCYKIEKYENFEIMQKKKSIFLLVSLRKIWTCLIWTLSIYRKVLRNFEKLTLIIYHWLMAQEIIKCLLVSFLLTFRKRRKTNPQILEQM
jgi:hypothetical protein